MPEAPTLPAVIDLAASAPEQPFVQPSTAGDALLAAQLQDEDQVSHFGGVPQTDWLSIFGHLASAEADLCCAHQLSPQLAVHTCSM